MTPSPATRPAVEVSGLAIRRPDARALLADATLTVLPGRVLALTGPSGAGKTTLLRAMAGVLPPGARHCAGQLTVLGHDVLHLPEPQLRLLRRHRLAYVGQDPGSALNPRLKIRQLIIETAAERDRNAATVRELLTLVRLPTDQRIEDRRPGALSGGQQRRAALARALARRPELLLLDEPTAGLDPALRDEIADLLRELAHGQGIAVVVASHDPELVARCADQVTTLSSSPRPAATALRRAAATSRTARDGGLSVRGLSAQIGSRHERRTVLDGIALDLPRGSATGIIGASGSGKTTLIRVLAGLHPPTAGTVRLDGTPLHATHRRRTRDQRRAVQLIPQNPLGALNPARTVGSTLARPLQLHRAVARHELPVRIAELLELVQLPADFTDRYPGELSGGQRQRVSIARALAADPDILLCDEVTSALDTDTATGITELLAGLQESRGLTLALVSHDLTMITAQADALLVLDSPATPLRTGSQSPSFG